MGYSVEILRITVSLLDKDCRADDAFINVEKAISNSSG